MHANLSGLCTREVFISHFVGTTTLHFGIRVQLGNILFTLLPSLQLGESVLCRDTAKRKSACSQVLGTYKKTRVSPCSHDITHLDCRHMENVTGFLWYRIMQLGATFSFFFGYRVQYVEKKFSFILFFLLNCIKRVKKLRKTECEMRIKKEFAFSCYSNTLE